MTITLSKFLFLLSVMLLVFATVSCHSDGNGETDYGEGGNGNRDTINMPDSDSVSREFTEFSEIVYSRPDYESLISDINGATELIQSGDADFDTQLAAIISLEDGYNDFRTMYTYNIIATSKNAADKDAIAESLILSEAYPDVMGALEGLMVAAASSPHAEKFEEEYFGDGLIEEYSGGGIFTDEVIALLKEEARLESEYTSISTATVEITFENVTASFEDTVARLSEKYGKNSYKYELALSECERLYAEAELDTTISIFLDLIRTRRRIADALGCDSYADYAYDTLYHDYEPGKMDAFLDDIANYVIPVYKELESTVFNSYFRSVNAPRLSREKLINTLYSTYSECDEDLAEIYAYMLLSGYYDVAYGEDNRLNGAFTTYLDGYSSPFVFATVHGNVTDIATLSHEFGHFADSYINLDEGASLDTLEVSSQALELLTLEMLRNKLSSTEYRYLLYSEIQSAFLTLIYQGFYATFEREVYELSYDEITEEGVAQLVKSVARDMGLPQYELEVVLIDHTILYPFYVQSYCTSIVSSLDIYLIECKNKGEGVRIYKELIDRENELSFVGEIESVGLDSPFLSGRLKDLSNSLYYKINGYNYYRTPDSNDKVA